MTAVRFAQRLTAIMAAILVYFGYHGPLFPVGFILGCVSLILWGLVGYVRVSEPVDQQIEDALAPTYSLDEVFAMRNATWDNAPDDLELPYRPVTRGAMWPNEIGAPE